MKLEKLNEQQRMKLRDCKTNEELLSVIQSEKIELDAEDLDCVSGGSSMYCGNERLLYFSAEEAAVLLKFLKQQDQTPESAHNDFLLTDEPLMPSASAHNDFLVTGLHEALKP